MSCCCGKRQNRGAKQWHQDPSKVIVHTLSLVVGSLRFSSKLRNRTPRYSKTQRYSADRNSGQFELNPLTPSTLFECRELTSPHPRPSRTPTKLTTTPPNGGRRPNNPIHPRLSAARKIFFILLRIISDSERNGICLGDDS